MSAKGIKIGPEERKVYDFLFERADSEQLGVLTGDKAVTFFDAAQLPPQTLGEIWAAADDENTGFLTKEQFYAVCRMIGQAQNGQEPTMSQAGPLPAFKGISMPGGAAKQPSLPSSSTNTTGPARALSPSLTGSGAASPARQTSTPAPSQGITISPEDKAKFTRLFYSSGPSNGLIDGDKAYGILTKSGLSNEQLGQIWNLADTQSRGALDATDFTIAMALINATMSGKLRQLPDTLPLSVYAQAAAAPSNVGSGGSSMPTSPLRNQYTGNSATTAAPSLYPQSTGSFQGGRSVGAPSLAQSQSSAFGSGGGAWSISPSEKQQSDQFFNMLDTSRSGYIAGDIAVPFFVQSGLPEDTLASIWDLSDISKEGRLNQDEFAVARRLIMDALAGKQVPARLDDNMVPPSLRSTARQMQNQPQQSEVQKDLFSLMDDDEPAPQLPAAAASAFQPQQASRVTSPAPMIPQATGSSSRGIPAPMIPTHTGSSVRSGTPRAAPPPVPASRSGSTMMSPSAPAAQPARSNTFETNFGAEDSDGDEPAPAAVSRGAEPASDRSAELGNLKNQVNQTQRSVSTLRDERKDLSTRVSEIDIEIDELKVKLSQAKAAYDVESTNMSNLEARQKSGNADLKRLRQETITAESDLSALKEQKIELEQSILKDKEEIRGLKSSLKSTNDQVATLKDELERLKKEGRQQKGLLAVSRKQQATAESEREKIESAISAERQQQAQQAQQSHVNIADAFSPPAVAEAREIPLPPSNIASPAPSTGSGRSMNPFFNSGGGLAAPAAMASAARAPSPLNAFTLPQEEQQVSVAREAEDEDPFGMSKSGTLPQQAAPVPAAAQSGGFGFDDDFGSSFASKPSAGVAAQPTSSGFDDAFADFDKPASVQQQQQQAAPASTAQAHTVDREAPALQTHEGKDNASGTSFAGMAGMAAGAVIGVAGAAAAAVGLTSPKEEEEKESSVAPPAAAANEDAMTAPASLDKGKAPERIDASPFDEPAETAVVPAGTEAYQSRAVPDNEEDDASDGDLPPIRDVDRVGEDSDSDSDSDSEDDGSNTVEDAPRAALAPASHETSSGPGIYENQNEPGDLATSSRAVDFHALDAAPEVAEPNSTTGNDRSAVPGGFPGSAPSSVGDAEETFEDARSSSAFNARSASPPSPVGARDQVAPIGEASNFTEPVAPASALAVQPGSATSGFDDSFGSPFEATSPVTRGTSAGAVDGLPSTGAAVVPSQTVEGLPQTSANRAGDDFDDFEDLTPARVEEPTGIVAGAAPSRTDNGFNDNFDDDFGFDNQTFSHTITSQGVGKSVEPTGAQHPRGTSTGFDDAFDDAFGSTSPTAAAAASPGAGTRIAAPSGFDDDFFASNNNGSNNGGSAFPLPAGAAPAIPNEMMHPVSEPRVVPPLPSSSVIPNEPAPSYAPPPGPPPSQQQQQQRPAAAAAAPPLPGRNDNAGGELPQVQELMDMGFKKSQAVAALEDNQFDVGRAANALLAVNQ